MGNKAIKPKIQQHKQKQEAKHFNNNKAEYQTHNNNHLQKLTNQSKKPTNYNNNLNSKFPTEENTHEKQKAQKYCTSKVSAGNNSDNSKSTAAKEIAKSTRGSIEVLNIDSISELEIKKDKICLKTVGGSLFHTQNIQIQRGFGRRPLRHSAHRI